MTAIATQVLNPNLGTEPTLGAASTSDTYDCGEGAFALIKIGATTTVVTVVDPRVTEYGAAFPDIVMPTVASVTKMIPLPQYLANDQGRATILLSQATAVTCAGVRTA